MRQIRPLQRGRDEQKQLIARAAAAFRDAREEIPVAVLLKQRRVHALAACQKIADVLPEKRQTRRAIEARAPHRTRFDGEVPRAVGFEYLRIRKMPWPFQRNTKSPRLVAFEEFQTRDDALVVQD